MTEKGRSKINPVLAEGAGVVTTRHMVQNIVTEYGVAQLRGKSLAERARALIAIAHPSVREDLEHAACERFGYSFLRIR
jgi:acyl-CoA hydrolase